MKAITKKQFENAVHHVLNGGKSKLVKISEVRPFNWRRNGSNFSLSGTAPKYGKLLRNDAPMGGKAGEIYLSIEIADGYFIDKTKKEKEDLKRASDKKRKLKSQKDKETAKKHGFKSVAQWKRANKEVEEFNFNRIERMEKMRVAKFIEIYGENPNNNIIKHRVLLSRIEVNIYEPKKYFL